MIAIQLAKTLSANNTNKYLSFRAIRVKRGGGGEQTCGSWPKSVQIRKPNIDHHISMSIAFQIIRTGEKRFGNIQPESTLFSISWLKCDRMSTFRIEIIYRHISDLLANARNVSGATSTSDDRRMYGFANK